MDSVENHRMKTPTYLLAAPRPRAEISRRPEYPLVWLIGCDDTDQIEPTAPSLEPERGRPQSRDRPPPVIETR